MHTLVANLSGLWKVTLAGLVLGAGLPAIFAFGIRFWSEEYAIAPDGTRTAERNLAATAAAYLCFALVVGSVVVGILFIAKGFLASRLGIHIFGA
ncbi:hypothetical protein [Skermania piniformis]|uniref:DUF4190 domain-containing protein n=1 Tax=Skermania pinensis TaxID=39122 RepID=A0ABX8S9D5_9ACTN|nr:hypothetical protein [Skermania piniformis]QXQ14459.1 hypothetical protein KV203_03310 [Skermania piniformis]